MKKKLVIIALLLPFVTSCAVYKPQANTDREAEIIAKCIQVNNEFVEFFEGNSGYFDAEAYQTIVDYQNGIADDLELSKQLLEAYNDNPSDAVLASLKGILANVQEKLGHLQELKNAFQEWLEEQLEQQDKQTHDLKDTRIDPRSSQIGI